MALGKPLEEYSSAELDDLLKLMGVRQHILSRGHVDGYRLVRLTNAQLTGFPFTPMERWKLQMIRRSYTVFKIFTRGLGSGGSCPVSLITSMLRRCFSYNAVVVEEIKQGLLAHTVGMRSASGERVVTFDQWAQLFNWIGSRLDVLDDDRLKKRMGAHICCSELDEFRAPLQAANRTDDDRPCMPLDQPETTGMSFNLLPDLLELIIQPQTSSQVSDTSSLHEDQTLNSGDSALTQPWSPPPPTVHRRAIVPPSPAQSSPITNWAAPVSTFGHRRVHVGVGEMDMRAAAPSAQPLPASATSSVPARGRSPLSSAFPLHSATSAPQAAAAARRDRARGYDEASQGASRLTRGRSRSPERSQQMQIPGALSALGRLLQGPARAAPAVSPSSGSHHQSHLPVLSSLVESRGLPVAPSLPDSLVTAEYPTSDVGRQRQALPTAT